MQSGIMPGIIGLLSLWSVLQFFRNVVRYALRIRLRKPWDLLEAGSYRASDDRIKLVLQLPEYADPFVVRMTSEQAATLAASLRHASHPTDSPPTDSPLVAERMH